jgi:hypothetical protein
MGSKTKVGLTSVILLIGLAGARVGSLAEDPEATAVRETVLRGEQLYEQLPAMLPGYLGGPIDSQTKKARLADAREKLEATFAANLATEFYGSLAKTIDRIGDFDPMSPGGPFPMVTQDGGASAIDYPSVVVTGNTARVTVNIKSWVTMAQIREGKAYPFRATTISVVKETLAKQADGRWLIVSRGMTYPPGQGP